MSLELQDQPIPKISVIIPTIGRDTVPRVLQALEAQTLQPDQIIVSHDRQRLGASQNRNRAITGVKNPLVVMLDDNCLPEADWLERLYTTQRTYRADVVSGSYRETDPLLADLRKRRKFPETTQIDTQGFVGIGGNTLFTKAILNKVQEKYGYIFDTSLVTGEDHELLYRIKDFDPVLVFTPANPLHLKQVTFGSFITMQYYRGKGIAGLYKIKRSKPAADFGYNSALWGKNHFLTRIRKLLFRKILGPLDFWNFSTPRNFIFAWLGEKAQGVGFITGLYERKR